MNRESNSYRVTERANYEFKSVSAIFYLLRKSKCYRAGSNVLDAVLRKRYKKVYNIETSLCSIIQEVQNIDILKCLSQVLSKIQKIISSTKTTIEMCVWGGYSDTECRE